MVLKAFSRPARPPYVEACNSGPNTEGQKLQRNTFSGTDSPAGPARADLYFRPSCGLRKSGPNGTRQAKATQDTPQTAQDMPETAQDRSRTSSRQATKRQGKPKQAPDCLTEVYDHPREPQTGPRQPSSRRAQHIPHERSPVQPVHTAWPYR